jgi:protein translocase SecG subunit
MDLVVAVALIYIITIQESKNDGLQGQIGSKTTSSFKGKAGKDEQLNELTKKVAGVFFALLIIISMLGKFS